MSTVKAQGDVFCLVPAAGDAGDDVVPVVGFGAADIDGFAYGLDGVYEGESVVMGFHNQHDAAMLSAPIAVWCFDHYEGIAAFVAVEVEAYEAVG